MPGSGKSERIRTAWALGAAFCVCGHKVTHHHGGNGGMHGISYLTEGARCSDCTCQQFRPHYQLSIFDQ